MNQWHWPYFLKYISRRIALVIKRLIEKQFHSSILLLKFETKENLGHLFVTNSINRKRRQKKNYARRGRMLFHDKNVRNFIEIRISHIAVIVRIRLIDLLNSPLFNLFVKMLEKFTFIKISFHWTCFMYYELHFTELWIELNFKHGRLAFL